MLGEFTTQRVLIWGKTYPELSWHHDETVCTGGSFEGGLPVRIYPVPLRYLPRQQQYKLYDWVEISLEPSTKDRRPESRRLVRPETAIVGHLGPERGWYDRRKVIFADRSWHFQCLEQLKAEEIASKRSLGFIRVREVQWIKVVTRAEKERVAHERKMAEIQARVDLFGTKVKGLEFFPHKIRIGWLCESELCPSHTAAVMDWGLGEMARRDGIDTAVARMEELSKVGRYDLHIYAGNIKAHPRSFGIVGLWYPLKRDVEKYPLTQIELFS